jgi:hypothetical protein
MHLKRKVQDSQLSCVVSSSNWSLFSDHFLRLCFPLDLSRTTSLSLSFLSLLLRLSPLSFSLPLSGQGHRAKDGTGREARGEQRRVRTRICTGLRIAANLEDIETKLV